MNDLNELELIKDAVSCHSPSIIGQDELLKSSVCICLTEEENGLNVILEVRNSHLIPQPGDICLPGGMAEADESPEETAVRETCEELLVAPDQINLIGGTDVFMTGRIMITPYTALIRDYTGSFNTDEVQEILKIPVSFLLQTPPEEYYMEFKPDTDTDFPYDRIEGGREYKWGRRIEKVLFYKYGQYNIWGITAAILDNFVRTLKQNEKI